MTNVTRRDFLKASAAAAAGAVLPLPDGNRTAAAEPAKKWYKGDLHQHSLWSDGVYLPERTADWYKENGYHFICPSDHNCFQDSEFRFYRHWADRRPPEIKDIDGLRRAFEGETSYWKPVSQKPSWAVFDRENLEEHRKIYGDAIETRVYEGITFVRLKTFDEVAASRCEPGRFLMIPGFEQTTMPPEQGHHVHLNFINVREVFPTITPESAYSILEQNYRKGLEVYDGQDYLVTANHPLWVYYDFQPSDLIRLPQITLYELTNNSLGQPKMKLAEKAWRPEQMWDIVNAYRAAHDQSLLYGMGSDDFHSMKQWGRGWSVVRASKLEIPDILDAIRAGDFYASRGPDFEDIQFDGKTLAVKISDRDDAEYKIDFIGTKKDYSPECEYAETPYTPQTTLPRKLECYSGEIGKVLESAEGTEASYTLKPDDLYVRAKIYRKDDPNKDWETKAAWTQPYRG